MPGTNPLRHGTLPVLITEGESRTFDCADRAYLSVAPTTGASATVRSAMSHDDDEGLADTEVEMPATPLFAPQDYAPEEPPTGLLALNRTRVVDPSGGGHFTTIAAAITWFSANTTLGAGTGAADRGPNARWLLLLAPGRYDEGNLVLPHYVSLAPVSGPWLSSSALSGPPVTILGSNGSGALLTLQAAQVTGIEIMLTGTPTGARQALRAGLGWGYAERCSFVLDVDSTTHEVIGVDASAAVVWVRNCNFECVRSTTAQNANTIFCSTAGSNGMSIVGCVLDCHGYQPGCAVRHSGSGALRLSHCDLGQPAGPTFLKDLQNLGAGSLNVRMTNYRTANCDGTITAVGVV